ncbi:MAG: DUF1385 domain-containing protein [Bacillaceae bacterium]
MSNQASKIYGGQAVVEGVMFGGATHTVTAVRSQEDDSLKYYELKRETAPLLNTLKKIPFIRGIAAILQSTAVGSKHLQFSTNVFEGKEEEEVEVKKESNLASILGIALIGVLSFVFGKLLFTVVPAILANFTIPIFQSDFSQILIESLIKLTILLVYLYVISLTPMIKRLFQYHGAEHKVINCFENGLPLTVENVQKQSRLHYRCGSSFILFTVIVGFFIYMLIPVGPLMMRVISRILLIPVVLGVSFEVLQLTNYVRNIPILRYLGYPGLWLQLLTTKEPLDEQVEVAIASFEHLRKLEATTQEQAPMVY